MAGVQGSALAIAVSNAGALGSLPCATLSLDALRAELALLRSQARGPINVNFFCHSEPTFDADKEAQWRSLLQPYFIELGINQKEIAAGAGRTPFSHDAADALEEFKPEVVSFHFGLPEPALLERVKTWGALVLSSATTVAEARWLEAHGADAVIAQGIEAGGHRGMFLTHDLNTQLATFALVPQVVRAVQTPVIAAGGIVDDRSVAAAFALGASAVQVGTTYLLCPEATTSAIHRNALRSEDAQLTAITNVFTGRPARGIVNRLMRDLDYMNATVPTFPLATNAIAPLRRRCESLGRGDFSPLWAGQNVSGCRSVGAAELTRQLADGLPKT